MLPEEKSLRVQSLWLLKKALPSREEPDISVSIVNSKACFYTNALRAYYNFERVTSRKSECHYVYTEKQARASKYINPLMPHAAMHIVWTLCFFLLPEDETGI